MKRKGFTAHIYSKQGQKFIDLMKKHCRESGSLSYDQKNAMVTFFDKSKNGIERAIERLNNEAIDEGNTLQRAQRRQSD